MEGIHVEHYDDDMCTYRVELKWKEIDGERKPHSLDGPAITYQKFTGGRFVTVYQKWYEDGIVLEKP
jgi:hypothetical protein